MAHYTASVTYDARTLKRLGAVQSRSRVLYNLLYAALCFLLIVSGVLFGLQTPAGLVCIALGCLALPLRGAVGRTAMDNVINALGDRTIRVDYQFGKKDFTMQTQGKQTRFAYGDLIRLWEDKEYFYLFPSKKQGFMIEKASISPSPERFGTEMAKETGLEWNSSASLLKISGRTLLRDWQRAREQRKKED